MVRAFAKRSRAGLGELLDTQETEAKKALAKKRQAAATALGFGSDVAGASVHEVVDAPIEFDLLVPPGGDQSDHVDQFTLTLSQALRGTAKTGDAYATSRLKKVGVVFSCLIGSVVICQLTYHPNMLLGLVLSVCLSIQYIW